ncbi:MAG: DUF1707 domain-containing protein [Gemmatimonadaceae bacterium]
MATDPPVPPIPAAQLEAHRARTIQTLSDHFAQDHLSLEEFEERVERVYRATTPAALAELTAGLPVLAGGGALAEAQDTVPSLAVGERKTILAIMGGVVRRGVWSVPSRIHAIAVMGAVELDLREARLPPGVTEIVAFALMGAVEILVPPHVRVETDGIALLGGFEDQLHQPASADPAAPAVRVTGLAIMGGVEARVQPAGPALPPSPDRSS